ncbi:sigma factor-like helix-turn-helix DNA-binding protein [Actinotalea ferrariae]|uniref:sigma factor-like helix-turn-helix DNA-binding protein n=1 Tax=Actinotalea ferrariae TaxID=1386098 RepID=UPI0027DFC9FA|nr:sigma factor-like helix-turn-helix DNA-binding protein [Actinotalea ferrariae]
MTEPARSKPGGRPHGLLVAAVRSASPRALANLVRRIGDFADAEDALQEALVAAATQWPRDGIPAEPAGWLTTVALRRWSDAVRAGAARRERERRAALLEAAPPGRPPDDGADGDADDTLSLYLLCCHPALRRSAQLALTLRVMGGLTTREIARALLVPEATVAQRISRAKATLRSLGRAEQFPHPDAADLPQRVAVVLEVLGVVHTEAHSPTGGDAITRPLLAVEALRLARELLARTPDHAPWRGEVMGWSRSSC